MSSFYHIIVSFNTAVVDWGGAQGTRAPLGSIDFIFMQFSSKMLPNNKLVDRH